MWHQIAEEGNYMDDEDLAERTPLRVQFADTSKSIKDAMLLQPVTSDDGYLTPTTRTTNYDADIPYLDLVDSPTDATPSLGKTPFSCSGIH